MATEINAGRVAMVPKGEWSASTAYVRLDVVYYNGSSYVASQDSTGQNPSTATNYWQLLARGVDPSNYYTKTETNTKLGSKQDALVSGTNIKSINGQSVLGEGNLELGELFVVTMTRHNSVYTADKSVSEIYAASYTNGKPVIAVMRDINTPILILTDCDPDGDSYVFSAIESNTVTTLRWQRTDDYTYELETVVLQPHLVSGTNIKTLNNESLLGSGNVDIVGKSAYQSYVDTTTDSPVKTEAEWIASLKGEDGVDLGEVAIADDQTTDDATKVLSARQGYLLGQKVNDVDDVPTAGSEKFVKSGGVQNELALGAIYDVSVKNPTAGQNNDGKFESLSALLSDANLNTLIPTAYRKGGMSIKFVQSSDNNSVYVQYRLMAESFTTDTTQWQGVDERPVTGSRNFVESGGVSKALLEQNVIGNGALGVDLAITDDNGYDIAEFAGGHIKTKEFDSSVDATETNRGMMTEAHYIKLAGIETGAEVNNTVTDDGSYDLAFSDGQGHDIVQFDNGHIKTKYFDSSIDASSEERGLMTAAGFNKLNGIEQGAEVNDVITSNHEDYDFTLSDESGKDLAQFSDGHFKTKNFDSRDFVEVKDKVDNGLTTFPYPSFVGSPAAYTPSSIDTTGLAVFGSVEDLYAAFDALVTQYPDWFKKEADLGKDASGNYDMRHYTIRMQHPSVHADRAVQGQNLWDDATFKYRHILVNMSVHSNEQYSTLGGYLAVKEILESTEPWAMFIKNNFVVDIVPCNNPWGLNDGLSLEAYDYGRKNSNNIDLNRDYLNGDNAQQETKNMKALISDLIPKGLVAVIDLHNASSSHGGYFVCKTSYNYYKYYAVLTQQMQAVTYGLWGQVVSTKPADGNYFHLWNYADSPTSVGQLHEYVNSLGLFGGTFEIKSSLGLEGSILTKVLCINYISTLGAY